MPAFAKVESDEHIWDLVLYLRTLPGAAKSNAESRNKTSRRFSGNQDLALSKKP